MICQKSSPQIYLKFLQSEIHFFAENVCSLILCLFKHYDNRSETVFYLNHGFSPCHVFIHVAYQDASAKYILACSNICYNFIFFITILVQSPDEL